VAEASLDTIPDDGVTNCFGYNETHPLPTGGIEAHVHHHVTPPGTLSLADNITEILTAG